MSFPGSGDLLNPGIEPGSPALQVDSLPSEPAGKPRAPFIRHKDLSIYRKLDCWFCAVSSEDTNYTQVDSLLPFFTSIIFFSVLSFLLNSSICLFLYILGELLSFGLYIIDLVF